MRNLDALQNCFNTLVHLAQGFANVAAVALVALTSNRHAGSDKQRAIDCFNYLESRNRVRRARQRVAAIDAMLRLPQASLGQALQNLGQSFGRYAIGVGDVFGATETLTRIL